ncbi:radical SAM superfamily enzyme [Actinobacteria bacterium IMCC26207]|nr:radical SAM superfamily enzyme [Actinobacteria bacterium IMCC26207]
MKIQQRISKKLRAVTNPSSTPRQESPTETERLPESRSQKIASLAFESACYAPTVSMYFDQFGKVRACCQNTGALMGDVAQQSIRDIWESASTARMRSALKVGDYSEGCGFCEWQVNQGDEAIVFARVFDDHTVTQEHPRWPVQMEFSMTNSCNLQCQMCNGDWSSSIRTHREHRPPLPVVYQDSFFEELAEFLPHLEKVNFLGGEPFLGKEPLRVMTMLAELPHPPEVAVTTNGTQWSNRIEQICEQLPISFVLSLDGITASTYEGIRIGADFEQVMANLERFESYATRHGTKVSLAHCLMRSNWHEFAQFLRFAEDRGFEVGMNEVIFPVELSLFQMPPEELSHVVSAMERDESGIAASLDALKPTWDGQLDALRNRLATLEGGQLQYIRPWAQAEEKSETWEEQAGRLLAEWVCEEVPARIELGAEADLGLSGSTAIVPTCSFGDRSYYLSQLGLQDAESPEQLISKLCDQLGSKVPMHETASDLIQDLIIGDPTEKGGRQFRVAWSTSESITTAFVAVQNPPEPPVLPENPRAVLTEWCGADSVVLLRCDKEEVILSTEGSLKVIGADSELELRGLATDFVLGQLVARYGEMQITPGPSGSSTDSMVAFADGAAGVVLQLRVVVERLEDAVVFYIGSQDLGSS